MSQRRKPRARYQPRPERNFSPLRHISCDVSTAPASYLCEPLEHRRLLAGIVGFSGILQWSSGSLPELNAGNTVTPDQSSPNSGAVSAIAPHPSDPNTVYIATVNGGIWVTHDALDVDLYGAKPVWQPLTDRYPSLSFGSIVFDPSDSTNQTLWAGYAWVSSGALDGELNAGLLKTTDGGKTWVPMGVGSLGGNSVVSIIPTAQIDPTTKKQIILVATNGRVGTAGVWRSNDGGATFTDLAGAPASGLPAAGSLDEIVADPGNDRYYAAIVGQGVYVSQGNQGAAWTPVNTGLANFTTAIRMRLAVFENGVTNAAYVVIVYPNPSPTTGNSQTNSLASVYRSSNQGGSWTAMDQPTTIDGGATIGLTPEEDLGPDPTSGGQGVTHLSIIADKTNPNVVYVGGDRQSSPFPNSVGASQPNGRLFRGDASQPTGKQWTSITNNGANGTAPHADSRAMAWDATGDLFEGDDGGIFRLTGVGGSGQKWIGAIGNLDVHEIYSVGYIPGEGFVFGIQDTGTAEPQIPNGTTSLFVYNDVTSGDGNVVAVDSTSTPQRVFVYTSQDQFQTFQVQTFNSQYQQLDRSAVSLTVNGSNPTTHVNDYNSSLTATFDTTLPFVPPYLLNAADPTHMLVGSNYLYESTDRGANVTLLNGPLINNLPDPTKTVGPILPLAYGGFNGGVANTSVIFAATGPATALTDPPSKLTTLLVRTSGSGMPTAVAPPGITGIRAGAVDPGNYNTFFLADSNGTVWRSTDAAATAGNWTNITSDLGKLTGDLRCLLVLDLAGKQFLFAGGANGVFFMNTADPKLHWRKFGNGLPETLVKDIHYDPGRDMLYAGTWGRGVWSILQITPFLSGTATTLNIKGDNDSPGEVDVFTLTPDPNIADPANFSTSGLLTITRANGFQTTTYSVDAACLDQINIAGGAGADLYKILGVPAGGLVGGIPIHVNVGTATATVDIANATGLTNANVGLLGPVNITGAAGDNTTLIVDDQYDPSKAAAVTVNTSQSAGNITGLSTAAITYDGTANVTSVNLLTDAGSSSVSVVATGVPTTINGNRTNNATSPSTFFIGSGGSVQTIAAPLTIEDPGVADTILVQDASEHGSPPITLDQFTPPSDTPFGRVSGLSAGAISFRIADLYTLTVTTGTAGNAIVMYGPGSPGGKKQVLVNFV